MKSGEISCSELHKCSCGSNPVLVWHYIKGTANRIHYFVKCNNCKTRIKDRKEKENAIKDWNNQFLNKNEIINILKILSMVTGDCPYERGISNQGNQGGQLCDEHKNCIDCWKSELSKELDRLNK